jgi:hypothetical protein
MKIKREKRKAISLLSGSERQRAAAIEPRRYLSGGILASRIERQRAQ